MYSKLHENPRPHSKSFQQVTGIPARTSVESDDFLGSMTRLGVPLTALRQYSAPLCSYGAGQTITSKGDNNFNLNVQGPATINIITADPETKKFLKKRQENLGMRNNRAGYFCQPTTRLNSLKRFRG